jgi:hypothetical protein
MTITELTTEIEELGQIVEDKQRALGVFKESSRALQNSKEPAENIIEAKGLTRDLKALKLRLDRSKERLPGTRYTRFGSAVHELNKYIQEVAGKKNWVIFSRLHLSMKYRGSDYSRHHFTDACDAVDKIVEDGGLSETVKGRINELKEKAAVVHFKEEGYRTISEVIDDSSFIKKVKDLTLQERLVLGEYIHDEKILALGCEDFGDYKSPTDCGRCVDARSNLTLLGLRKESKKAEDRNYRIPKETMVSAKGLDGILSVVEGRVDAAEIDLRITRNRLDRLKAESTLLENITVDGLSYEQKLKLVKGLVDNKIQDCSILEQTGEYFVCGSSVFDSKTEGSSVIDHKLNRIVVLNPDGRKVAETSDRYLWRTTSQGILGNRYEFDLKGIDTNGKNIDVDVGGHVFHLEVGDPIEVSEEHVSMMPSRVYNNLVNAVMTKAEEDFPPLTIDRSYIQQNANRGISSGVVPLYTGQGTETVGHLINDIQEGDNELVIGIRRVNDARIGGIDTTVDRYSAKVGDSGEIFVKHLGK